MTIQEGHKANFETLKKAAANGNPYEELLPPRVDDDD